MKKIGILTSGGDCQGLNAAIRGVAKGLYEEIDDVEIYGIQNGYAGLIHGDYKKMNQSDFSGILTIGGTILGTSRQPFKMMRVIEDENSIDKVAAMKDNYKKMGLDCLVILGGNGTHKTANLLSEEGLNVVTMPKTIDNDLVETDHCPGFASAAKYIATSVMEVARDCRVYNKGMITIIECMGRHAGWLTAATVLPAAKGDGPDLIYLPEVDFDMADFLDDVIRVYEGQGQCLVAVSEGIHYSDGAFVSEAKTSSTDGFGHAQLGGLAHRLAGIVSAATGAKVRGIELSLLQRCAAHCASATDIEEAFQCGKVAVESALRGETGKMVGMVCKRDGGYSVSYELFDLRRVANAEKKIPLEWITSDNAYVTDAFIDYCTPLLEGQTALGYEDGLPRFARLKKVFAK